MRTVADRTAGTSPATPRWDRRDGVVIGVLALVTYGPLFLTNWGRLAADTKLFLYLDPGNLFAGATRLWNRRVSGGTVTHQNIGYLWPMGPYYWLTDVLGLPDWIAQRLWMGTIMFVAAAGAYWLFRSLWSDRRGAAVGAVVYGVSPFVLGHITGQSALLLPFSALPWLIVAVRNALRADPWRWAAVFALVTATAGSLNGSSIFFVLFGAVLWIPYAVWWERSTDLRPALAVLARLIGLTVATQLWWLMAYSVGGAFGLPILQVTETVRETSATTSAAEIFRGLGYWFFYGGDNQGPWLEGIAPAFTQTLALLAVSFVAPFACVVLGWWSRFRERAFFFGLVVSGLLLSTIAFGSTDRSLVGSAFESLSRHSGLVLSLRNTQRATALTILGLAGLAAAGIAALGRRQVRWARSAAAVVVVAALCTFAGPWSTALVADRYARPETVPRAWVDTARYLDRVGGRALLSPGEDFASYRWGHTLDPVLAGLTRSDLMWRELLPMGGEAGADLLGAFDEGLQEGWFDPRAIVPVARALGVRHIVVANDLEVERYRIPRPETVMAAYLDPASGLTLERAFGPGYENQRPGPAIVDDIVQRTRVHVPTRPMPQVAVFSVPGVTDSPVTATVKGAETVVHGDGAGVLAAAAAGLLDPDHVPLLTGPELAIWPAARRAARGPGVRHIVTDTSRKEVRRFTALRENHGATQAADGTPRSGVTTDVEASAFTRGTRASQSVVELLGATSIDASGYGNVVSLLPEDRPANAFDGDPRTSWRYDSPSFRPVRPDNTATLSVDLGRRVSADYIDVVQPTNRPGTQTFTSFVVVLDGTREIRAAADPTRALDPAGTRVQLDGRPFSTLELRVPDQDFAGPVGVAELVVPGVQVEELVALPRSLEALRRGNGPVPLAYVLTRWRLDPGERLRMDPEISMRRTLRVPATMSFALSGTARLDGRADDPVLDAVSGTALSGATFSSSARLLGDATSRASAAADGDRSSAWSTPLGSPVGASWAVTSDRDITLSDLPIDVVTDRLHSLPTRVGITVDGVTQEFALPPLATTDPSGSTTRVVVTPDVAVTGRTLRVEILAVEPRTGADLAGTPVTLPVAFAEVETGVRAPAAARVSTGCRADLVTLDGTPLPVRIDGEPGPGGTGPLTVTPCAEGPIVLTAGAHTLRTAPGLGTGIDLDRLVLVSPQFAAAPAVGTIPGAPMVVRADPGSAVVAGEGSPYWVRLNQSANRGWEAAATWPGGSRDLGTANPIDAFASGWSMVQGSDARATVRFSWPPQRRVDLALGASGLAVLGCLALVTRGRRRGSHSPAGPAPRLAPDPWTAPEVPAVALVLAIAIGTVFASVAVGVALAGFAVGVWLAERQQWIARAVRIVPLGTLAAAVAFFVLQQVRYDYPHSALWPAQMRVAHGLVFFGLLAGALLVLGDRHEDLGDRVEPHRP
ncbi:MAG: alpha-(1-_3)-arabinofuranosyltransferase family protein [Actinomycetota bacterium]